MVCGSLPPPMSDELGPDGALYRLYQRHLAMLTRNIPFDTSFETGRVWIASASIHPLATRHMR